VSSLPFVVYLQLARGDHEPILRDAQIRSFLALLCGLIAILWIYRLSQGNVAAGQALREVIFNISSILTGTGYTNAAYDQWGNFPLSLFFIAAFIGGCAGSTACGLKIFRLYLIAKLALRYMRQLIHPNGVFSIRYNNRPLAENVAISVLVFAMTYFICFAVIAGLLGLMGLDLITAISASASTIANVGPGLGAVVGPNGNYASLPDMVKWVLCVAMLLGRLELFAVLVMLTPAFWRR